MSSRRPPRVVTWTVAIIAGVVAGLAARSLLSRLLDARAVAAIESADAETRSAGWQRLSGGTPPRHRAIAGFPARLAGLEPDARADAARSLAASDDWRWDRVPDEVLLAWIESDGSGAPELVGELMWSAPDRGDRPVAGRIAAAIWAWTDASDAGAAERRRARGEVLAWLGQDPSGRLASIPADTGPAEARRELALAAAATSMPIPPSTGTPIDDERIIEAQLLARARLATDADDLQSVLEAAERAAERDPGLPIAAIIAAAPPSLARPILDRRASEGDELARRLVVAIDPERDATAARTVLARGRAESPLRRLIAATRTPPGSVAAVAGLADRALPDPEIPPALIALVVAEHVDADDAGHLAAEWMTDLDDRRKQAGAVLHALVGGPPAPLAAASAREDQGDVRLIQRLALAAIGAQAGGDDRGPDPADLADRAAPGLAETAGLLLALGGDPAGLRPLTAPESGRAIEGSAGVALRHAALEWLVPDWTAAVGRPVGGSGRALALHHDRLEIRRRLLAPRLRFEPSTRRFASPGLPRAPAAPKIAP